MAKTPKIEFDKLQLYFREPYLIDLKSIPTSIVLLQPTIGDIVSMGEKRFYGTLNTFITNTTSYRLPLWEAGIDWNDVSNFELFTILYPQIDLEIASLLFGNVDFSKMTIYEQVIDDKKQMVLFDVDNNIMINEEVYNYFSQYFQTIFNIFPEEKLTKDPFLKQMYIQKDKAKIHNDEYKEKHGGREDSSMQTIISACINHPGFKYKLSELREVGVYEFYDSVKRLQVYENSTALLKGMYSGFIDGSKIKSSDYNFMKEI